MVSFFFLVSLCQFLKVCLPFQEKSRDPYRVVSAYFDLNDCHVIRHIPRDPIHIYTYAELKWPLLRECFIFVISYNSTFGHLIKNKL